MIDDDDDLHPDDVAAIRELMARRREASERCQVIDLSRERSAREPHITFPARCVKCGYEWQAVCPLPVPSQLDCAECAMEYMIPIVIGQIAEMIAQPNGLKSARAAEDTDV